MLASATYHPVEALSPMVVEVLASGWSLSLAGDLDLHSCCFETDCLALFEAWKRLSRGRSYFDSIISDFSFASFWF